MEKIDLKKLEELKGKTNNPKLKESIRKKMGILKGDKTVLK